MTYNVLAVDVASRWKPTLTDAETALAEARIADAELLLAARVPSLAANVAAGRVAPELVKTVIIDMVLRLMKNPDGKRQESIDDYSWTRDTALSAGALYISDEEIALLTPEPVRTRIRVGSVRLGGGCEL